MKACFDEKTSYIPPKVQTLVKIDHTCILQTVAYFLENRIYFYFCYNVIKVCMVPLICPHIHRIAAYCVFFLILILGCNIYVVGGICTQSGEAVDTMEVLDCETATWEEENEEEFRPVIGVACVLMPRL